MTRAGGVRAGGVASIAIKRQLERAESNQAEGGK